MKFSTNYIFYPNNRELIKAIEHSKSLASDQVVIDDSPDDQTAVRDNFLHTRGNFEQRRYSSNVLENARETLEALLIKTPREEAALDWAALQNSLGNILAALGQHMSDADLYEKAIESFNNALEILSQEETPLEWATAQYCLGTAAQALGRQQSNSKILKLSIDAYTNALLEWSREKTPDEWSSTMHQLGATFHAHGALLKGNRTFQKAVVSYKNALAELDADNDALELVATHNNRGAVLHHLAESEENTGRMEEAIRSYETALTVCMEQQLPFHLAVLTRVNKSTARAVLAEMTKDSVTAEEAADDFEIIIECFDNALQPLCLKHCEEQLIHTRSMTEAFSGS